MTRVQTIVQLSGEMIEQLDAQAFQSGRSRSAVIRDAVNLYLEEAERDRIGDQIAAGYKRIPQDTPDEWGDLSAFSEAAALDTARRLDAEEKAQGLEPW